MPTVHHSGWPWDAVRARIWQWGRLLAGVAILVLLAWRLGTGAFLDGLRVIDAGTLLVALGIGLLTTVCSAARWCLVARGLGIALPLGTAVADYYRALFLNAALPGGVLGDVHRAVRHGREVRDVGRGVRAVVLERTAGQVVLFGVATAVLLTLPVPIPPGFAAMAETAAVAGALVAMAMVVTVAVVTVVRRSSPGARSGPSWWTRAVRRTRCDLRSGLLARGTWPGVTLLSVVVLGGHLATFLVAARAAGSSAPIGQLVPLMVLALLAMAVPLNVGGWGPREGVTAWAFGAAGLGAGLGLTVAVVYGLLALTASLPGAAVLAVRGLRQTRADRVERPAPPVLPLDPLPDVGAELDRELPLLDQRWRPQPVA
ncbi:lysylphosphatidylglycerol synthase transmembrane domain-containing protein [Solwaraspora sp. WMMD406]|uniref:lysylphosphatidylglycerol synthase transmembrane domain-containing protein n=1 Tax=Solwaraspora sp. WMMD406 TaxID=3016095 RepID=UPI00241654E1|nr:lysylphosphatidylglycerol synthase transmembrane domain-containing protein [Solwaraspora sp. WMMD406]MDG4766890.1 lysylphosphatidylglycerol synthase transmembrane domain-containing protein [Solwaraspora sp. WMMD406]